MSAEIIQFIPRPNPNRDREKGVTETGGVEPEKAPYNGEGIDGMTFTAPDSDPA